MRSDILLTIMRYHGFCGDNISTEIAALVLNYMFLVLVGTVSHKMLHWYSIASVALLTLYERPHPTSPHRIPMNFDLFPTITDSIFRMANHYHQFHWSKHYRVYQLHLMRTQTHQWPKMILPAYWRSVICHSIGECHCTIAHNWRRLVWWMASDSWNSGSSKYRF